MASDYLNPRPKFEGPETVDSVRFEVEAVFADGTAGPVPKGRPRLGKTKTYTPTRTRQWEKLVKESAALAMRGRPPFSGVVSVTISFLMPVPQSWSKRKMREALSGGHHARRPDIDNLGKACLDAMDGVVFEDDGQIAGLFMEKKYSETPGVIIYVRDQGERL